MYKMYDAPKADEDIVNKRYVDSKFSSSSGENAVFEIRPEDWIRSDEDNTYSYTINHNLNSTDLVLSFYNTNNENLFIIYYKILDKDNILIISEKNEYRKVVINHSSNNIDDIKKQIEDLKKAMEQMAAGVKSKVFEIQASDWVEDTVNQTYSYTINHNFNSTDLMLSFYNELNENTFIVYYKILDENNVVVVSKEREYQKVLVVMPVASSNKNKVIEIQENEWVENAAEKTYTYTLVHNLNSTNLVLSFYNSQNENIFLVYYKITDENTVVIASERKEYRKVILMTLNVEQ